MAFIVDAPAVVNEQHLGRFMTDPEKVRHLVGDRAIVEEVQIIEIDAGGFFGPFQPALYEGAGGATRTVLEDQLGAAGRSFFDLIQLRLCLQRNPIHVVYNTGQ